MILAEKPGNLISLAVIAGGKSCRMRRDKAFVELGGMTMIKCAIVRSYVL